MHDWKVRGHCDYSIDQTGLILAIVLTSLMQDMRLAHEFPSLRPQVVRRRNVWKFPVSETRPHENFPLCEKKELHLSLSIIHDAKSNEIHYTVQKCQQGQRSKLKPGQHFPDHFSLIPKRTCMLVLPFSGFKVVNQSFNRLGHCTNFRASSPFTVREF